MTPKDRKILLCRIEEKIYTAVKRIDQFSGPFNAEEVAVEILDFFENPMIMAKLITPVQDTPTAFPTALSMLSAQDIATIRAGAREKCQGIVVESDGIKKEAEEYLREIFAREIPPSSLIFPVEPRLLDIYIAGEDLTMLDIVKVNFATDELVRITNADWRNKNYLGQILRNIAKGEEVRYAYYGTADISPEHEVIIK